MSQESRIRKTFAAVHSDNFNFGSEAISQATSITNAVTAVAQSGIITTVSSTLAANTSVSFTVNHQGVSATTPVLANLCQYTGAGAPVVTVTQTAASSFQITIRNVHDSVALNAALKIAFLVMY